MKQAGLVFNSRIEAAGLRPLLKRKRAPIPYIALWVDNPEMLTKAD